MPTRRQRQAHTSRAIMNWKLSEKQAIDAISRKEEKERKKNNHKNARHNQER